jgi:competence protein ComEA
MMRGQSLRRLLLSGCAVVLISGWTAAAQNSPPADDHPTLPAGPGRELMIKVCSQCHSPDQAADQQLDEAGWKTLVDQMASKGAEATEAELGEIVAYLAKAFPVPK